MKKCDNCRKNNRWCGQMFTKYRCNICKKSNLHSNTCIPKICPSCADKNHCCQYCEVTLK